MTPEKAYILGMLVGGGKISNKTFTIILPFNKWGMNPQKMNIIAKDILTRIQQRFQKAYNITVTYEIGNKEWRIKPLDLVDLTELQSDLESLQLPTNGTLLNTVNLAFAKQNLSSLTTEYFLSGIFDTRASLTKSHRRFNDNAPVVSIEIPGGSQNFEFVTGLCAWLTDLGSVTDQILFNHPCQHAPSDPTYKGWKKGFKIRFLVKSFLAKHSFALQAKAIDITALEKQQNKSEQIPCLQRKPKNTSAVSIHNDIDNATLPTIVRNKLYFHYHHICCEMNCPYAPKEAIENLLDNYENLVSFFPRLSKSFDFESLKESYDKIAQKYFSAYKIGSITLSLAKIQKTELYQKQYLDLEVGLAFLVADELNGKRHKGSKDKILAVTKNVNLTIFEPQNLDGTPILLHNPTNDRAIILSSSNSDFNLSIVKKYTNRQGFSIEVLQQP
jgi:hypothetical protein